MNTKLNILAVVLLLAATAFVFLRQSGGFKDVDPAAAMKLVGTPGTLILDVRNPGEFAEGYIQGAKLIPLPELENRLGQLGDKKDAPILVYCASGGRSASASMLLQRSGWTNVSNLRGGLRSWSEAGYPVVKGK